MKEFLENNKVTYNLMSFTAFKSLLLFSYLLNVPRSYKEIVLLFKQHPYVKETISRDTFRVYIYSLERLGCKIDKIKTADGLKYKLIAHPFKLKITDEQVKSLIKTFKIIVKDIEIEELLYLTEFFNKISYGIVNDDLKESFINLSPLKKINPNIISTLLSACKRKESITFQYKSPKSGIKNINLVAEKLSVSNGKIYLFGKSPEYKNQASFLAEKIIANPVIQLNEMKLSRELPITVECEIYGHGIILEKNEKIIYKDETKMRIEILSDNLFFTRQRILALGNKCKIIAPQDFKEEFVTLLKKMKEECFAEEI